MNANNSHENVQHVPFNTFSSVQVSGEVHCESQQATNDTKLKILQANNENTDIGKVTHIRQLYLNHCKRFQ